MTRFIALNLGILSKVIYWLSIISVLLQSNAPAEATEYLLAEIAIDSANCTQDVKWEILQKMVHATLKQHDELGLSGSGMHCGCVQSPTKRVCMKHKAVVKLLYNSRKGHVLANGTLLAKLDKELDHTPPGFVEGDERPYYICANVEVITDKHSDYRMCSDYSEPDGSLSSFKNLVSGSGSDSGSSSASGKAQSGGKPATASIVGAVLGSLAGLGLLTAAALFIYRHLKRGSHVEDSGNHSDVSPIIPGSPGFEEAPNSVPPAGTS